MFISHVNSFLGLFRALLKGKGVGFAGAIYRGGGLVLSLQQSEVGGGDCSENWR